MSDTVTISHRGLKHLKRKMVAIVEAWGFVVLSPEVAAGMITPKELSEKTGVSVSALNRLFNRKDCPPFSRIPGPSGRILKLTANPRLMNFIVSHRRTPNPERVREV